ncbi:MAG: hypothetical protein WEG36_07305 [Gemmatimonadota bacterium]
MIELKNDTLVFSFPEVHADAVARVEFQRTLRIPDDGDEYPLPPGLGRFPLRHVDDHAKRVPARWLKRGGVMLPMYQSEAMWLNFRADYPFAVKVATGKINAVTGESWSDGLHRDPQDYLVIPTQPWLDGYCVEKGVIRQFVAMPFGSGTSVEEQLTGSEEHGGVQITMYPIKPAVYEKTRARRARPAMFLNSSIEYCLEPDMGLAAGGRMRQEIYDDSHDFRDWDLRHQSRCFVNLANALVWRAITGNSPPGKPPTAKEYNRAGLPWFEYYGADHKALEGAAKFENLKSVVQIGKEKGEAPIPENESVTPRKVIELRDELGRDQVREGVF